MCTGMEIAALAATAGGTLMQHNAAQDAQSRQDQMTRQAQAQQDGLQRQAEQTAMDSTQQFDNKNLDDKANDMTDQYASKYKQSIDDVASKSQLPGTGAFDTPQVIADENARATGAANEQGMSRAMAAARLQGLGGAFNDANINMGRNSGTINQLATSLQGNASALNTDLSKVRPNGNQMLLGQVLGGVGQAAMGSALMGGGAAAGQTANITNAPGIPGISTVYPVNMSSGVRALS